MNSCETHQQDISAYIDRELAQEDHAALSQHIEACGACADLERDLRALAIDVGNETRSWQDTTRTRTHTAVHTTTTTRTWRRSAAVAAAALVLIGIAWRFFFVGTEAHPNEEARQLLTNLKIDSASPLYIRTIDEGRTAVEATRDGSRWIYRVAESEDGTPTDRTPSHESALAWLQSMGIDALQREETLRTAQIESAPDDPFDLVRARVSRTPTDGSDLMEAVLRFERQTGKLLSMELGPFSSEGRNSGFAWIEISPEPSPMVFRELNPEVREALEQLGYLGGE